VSNVKYWHSLGYVMSCSNDEKASLHLLDVNVHTRGSTLKIRKGVISFDFCREWNIIGEIIIKAGKLVWSNNIGKLMHFRRTLFFYNYACQHSLRVHSLTLKSHQGLEEWL
jgi:hypothetical protein